ncbi:TMhelix containing protein [Vibrio phage 2.275.O._10N.286.54.E11]|nr:TMhelix containing protein [Vibrio phage 2.275.O._10N.286.54.E11]
MKELLFEVYGHLMSDAFNFLWWEIYAYWGTVVMIFVVDNTLRHRYNKKLKIEHDAQKTDMDHRLDAARVEINKLKHEVQWYIMRDGGVGSVMDIKDYHVKVATMSYSKGDPLELNYSYKLTTNFPILKG